VSHKAIEVNGQAREHPVLPAARLRCIVREKSRAQLRIKASLDLAEQNGFPSWVEVDPRTSRAFKACPTAPSSPTT
jgi:small subunit ribosomal protein S4